LSEPRGEQSELYGAYIIYVLCLSFAMSK